MNFKDSLKMSYENLLEKINLIYYKVIRENENLLDNFYDKWTLKIIHIQKAINDEQLFKDIPSLFKTIKRWIIEMYKHLDNIERLIQCAKTK